MIQMKKLFAPVNSIEAEEAKAYMAKHREGEYTVLDVRQPWEYEDEHFPGARLMPLPQLPDTYKELDPEKPTIVHCATGGRSRVAAQMLNGWGFKEVYNLAGGIKAFQGHKAIGPQELNLSLVRGDETPTEIITLAYGMEKALQLFYETLVRQGRDQEDRQAFEDRVVSVTLEGGFKALEFLEANKSHLETAPQVLDLAMMLETQALDLYLRFAGRCSQEQTREVLLTLAGEEKDHLASLGRLLEEKLGKRG
jgi:rhodanese-related sulfurtransferase/rubrerythrin